MGREIHLARTEQLEQAMYLAADPGCDPINFHTVASGEQNDFREIAADLQPAAGAPQPRGVHRKLLPQFHWRGFVAESCNEEFHLAKDSLISVTLPNFIVFNSNSAQGPELTIFC